MTATRDPARQVYPTREAAIAAGWDDAEHGHWIQPGETTGRHGWIGLTTEIDIVAATRAVQSQRLADGEFWPSGSHDLRSVRLVSQTPDVATFEADIRAWIDVGQSIRVKARFEVRPASGQGYTVTRV